MIDYLRGQVQHIEADHIVMDVQGVGYRVFCANPYGFQGCGEASKVVYIHHHVREDAILLFGFNDREEQALFRKLLDVSGIGPRVALGILSGGRPEALIAAVQNEDLAYLTRLPGIGKKTAQRIVLDLKDKLGVTGLVVKGGEAGSLPPSAGGGMGADSLESLRSAKEALMALGFSEVEIAKVWPTVKAAMKPDDSVDIVMKAALQQLYKG